MLNNIPTLVKLKYTYFIKCYEYATQQLVGQKQQKNVKECGEKLKL